MTIPEPASTDLAALTGLAVPDPGRQALDAHMRHPKFVSGMARGWWTVHNIDWPYLVVTVNTEDRADTGVTLQLDLEGYPQVAPTARPWDLDARAPMPPDRWPHGPHADQVFRQNWSVDQDGALYLPLDRKALPGHAWASEHPEHVWHPGRTVRDYLLAVRAILERDRRVA